jgi:predicted dehydrogenase
MNGLSVVLVGFGSIGRRHFENLHQLGVTRIVVVRRRQGSNCAFPPPAGSRIVHDCHSALASGPDLAIISNPTSLHVEAALPFVEAGVPVLLEKPVSHSLAQAGGLHDAASRHGASVGVAYCMRFHPAYRLAREALLAGRIGRPLWADAWFDSFLPDWHPWEDYRRSYAARHELGGGVLPTLDHEIDFFNWCFGRPQQVDGYTVRSQLLESEADDLARLRLRYPQLAGSQSSAAEVDATIELSLCRPVRRRGFVIRGECGSLDFDLHDNQLLLFRDDDPRQEVLWDGRALEINQMYLDLLSAFVDAVSRGGPMPVPLEAGLEALEIISRVVSWTAGSVTLPMESGRGRESFLPADGSTKLQNSSAGKKDSRPPRVSRLAN